MSLLIGWVQQNIGNSKSEKVSKKYLTGVGEEGEKEADNFSLLTLEVGSLARQAISVLSLVKRPYLSELGRRVMEEDSWHALRASTYVSTHRL